jgi:DNA-binding transcriptional LysR family regulator
LILIDIAFALQTSFSNVKNMEWDEARNFLAVAPSGSLSGAARLLDSSAATAGRRVAALEKRLGVRLFDRKQTGYAVTESGEAIRLKAEEVEEAVLALEREAFGRDLRAGGKVRLATAEDIATFLIAPRLTEFHRAYPGITVEMVAGWDVANLTRRDADLALRTARPARGDFIVRHVGVWRCAVYVSKHYARSRKIDLKRRARAKLPALDVIVWTDDHIFRSSEWFGKHARGSQVVCTANSRHIQMAACKAGLGAAILPCIAADADSGLVRLAEPEHVRSMDLWLVVHRDLVRTARVRAVMDFLVEIAPKRRS